MLLKILRLPLLLITTLNCNLNLLAGNHDFPAGAKQAGMGNAGVVCIGIWSLSHNQAGLAYLEKPIVSLYTENKFIMKELGFHALGIGIPLSNGILGASIDYFGYKLYHESKIGIGYSREFGKKIAFGLQLDYFNKFIGSEDHGNFHAVSFETGFLARPSENIIFGAHVFNPTKTKIRGDYDTKLPVIFKIGIGYMHQDKFLLTIEGKKDLEKKPVIKSGIEFMLMDELYLRAGISSNPMQNAFGLGYSLGKITADIAFTYHQLGLTPHLSFSYEFN
ncbi:MAG: hypothetical protein ACOCUL_03295 [Bacteroidota bacterium]